MNIKNEKDLKRVIEILRWNGIGIMRVDLIKGNYILVGFTNLEGELITEINYWDIPHMQTRPYCNGYIVQNPLTNAIYYTKNVKTDSNNRKYYNMFGLKVML